MEKKTKAAITGVSIITASVVILAALGGQVLGTTSVNVDVPIGTYSIGDVIPISIMCVPDEPIKAFELGVNFNKDVLQANEVLEGTIFTGYNTFFNAGTIQNDEGKITHIYNLIVGPGMVTNSGSFAVIYFTAVGTGLSNITLFGVGVTNDTQYLTIEVVGSSVFIYSQYDLNADGTVDILDLLMVANKYGETGAVGWIKEDVYPDGTINVLDLVMISNNWGDY